MEQETPKMTEAEVKEAHTLICIRSLVTDTTLTSAFTKEDLFCETDEAAYALAMRVGLTIAEEADGTFKIGMRSPRWAHIVYDTDLRLAVIRAIHFSFTEHDPAFEPRVLAQIAEMEQRQFGTETPAVAEEPQIH